MEEEIERIGCGLRPKERNACREMSRSLEKGEGENHPPRARREMQPNGIYKTIFLHSLNAFVDRRVSSSFLDPRDHRVRVCRPHGSQTMRVMRLSLPSIDFEILPPSPSPWNGDFVFFLSFAQKRRESDEISEKGESYKVLMSKICITYLVKENFSLVWIVGERGMDCPVCDRIGAKGSGS